MPLDADEEVTLLLGVESIRDKAKSLAQVAFTRADQSIEELSEDERTILEMGINLGIGATLTRVSPTYKKKLEESFNG